MANQVLDESNGEKGELPKAFVLELIAPKRKHLRVGGLLLGVGLGLIGLLTWPFMGRTAESPTDKITDQVQQAPAREGQSAPVAPKVGPKATTQSITDLKSQIEQVLTGIKEANQNKDLSQLLSYYSSNFPQLPQRAQSFSKNWKVYSYPKMEFEIKDIRLVAENNAVIKVTWNVEVQNISTKKSKDMSKTYLVRFVKESGQWRIKALEKTE
jgi:ketosteroid isomerase-like protein